MNTLHWHGFTALVNWLARGQVPADGYVCQDQPARKMSVPARPETAAQGAARQADEAAVIPRAPVRWGNFR
jgi:hypothetical protein